jgi:hypothetical protein
MGERKILAVTPREVRVGAAQQGSAVLLRVDLDQQETGLLGIELALRMSPVEARLIARQLVRAADDIEPPQ